MIVDLTKIPTEGVHRQGCYEREILDFGDKDSVRADPEKSVWYDLHLWLVGDELVLAGQIGAGVLLVCARCMEEFRDEVNLLDYRLEVAIEDQVSIDLTERIREDILLALPWYPNCAASTVGNYQCTGLKAVDELADDNSRSAGDSGEHQSAGGSDVWSVLDGLSDPKN
jgi:uncharacterized protein